MSHCIEGVNKGVHLIPTLKTKNCHDAILVVTGDTAGCQYDNLQCHQWWKSWHHDNHQISVYVSWWYMFQITWSHWDNISAQFPSVLSGYLGTIAAFWHPADIHEEIGQSWSIKSMWCCRAAPTGGQCCMSAFEVQKLWRIAWFYSFLHWNTICGNSFWVSMLFGWQMWARDHLNYNVVHKHQLSLNQYF